MKCPVDSATLLMSERQGIEIDYCPECRGVWLDRGELDKLIQRGDDDDDRGGSDRDDDRRGSDRDDDRRGDYSGDDDRRRGHEYESSRHQPKKKKKNFLSDMFENFGE
jgi:Zn-finger nucleic acid-binding protein